MGADAMSAPVDLFGFLPPPDRPARRCLWAAELRRLAALVGDERARDRQRDDAELAMLRGQLAELRARLSDVECTTGLADLSRPPMRRAELRRFAEGWAP
ncbi:MAG: hypothetical protein ACREFU_06535 [Acetobacteraceae bacterium]